MESHTFAEPWLWPNACTLSSSVTTCKTLLAPRNYKQLRGGSTSPPACCRESASAMKLLVSLQTAGSCPLSLPALCCAKSLKFLRDEVGMLWSTVAKVQSVRRTCSCSRTFTLSVTKKPGARSNNSHRKRSATAASRLLSLKPSKA